MNCCDRLNNTKFQLLNKLNDIATYDKELDEWSVNLDDAETVVDLIFNKLSMQLEERYESKE